MIEELSVGIRTNAILAVITFISVVIWKEPRTYKKYILFCFLFSVLGYLLAYWDFISTIRVIYIPSFYLSISLPFTFWLFTKALFDDDFNWKSKFGFIVIIGTTLNYILYTNSAQINEKLHFIPYLISAIFLSLAVYESLKNKEEDLIWIRLKIRTVFVLFSSIIGVISIYFFFIHNPLELPIYLQLIQNLSIIIFMILLFLSQFKYKSFFNIDFKTLAKNQSEKEKSEILKKIKLEFEENKLYLNEKINIRELSIIINEKEYLIRKTINTEMGYTNFNAFLNHYRISEACSIIMSDDKLSFKELAYKLGYQSVTSFNRAFKRTMKITPSEYLKNKLK